MCEISDKSLVGLMMLAVYPPTPHITHLISSSLTNPKLKINAKAIFGGEMIKKVPIEPC